MYLVCDFRQQLSKNFIQKPVNHLIIFLTLQQLISVTCRRQLDLFDLHIPPGYIGAQILNKWQLVLTKLTKSHITWHQNMKTNFDNFEEIFVLLFVLLYVWMLSSYLELTWCCLHMPVRHVFLKDKKCTQKLTKKAYLLKYFHIFIL